MNQVREAYGCPNDLLIVSDQHNGIQHAVKEVYPEAFHGYCTFHRQKKIVQWGKHIVGMYNGAAYAYHPTKFQKCWDNIRNASPDGAFQKLNSYELGRWARVH